MEVLGMVGSCERDAQILDAKEFLYKTPFSEVQPTNLYETKIQLARLQVTADPGEYQPSYFLSVGEHVCGSADHEVLESLQQGGLVGN